MNVGLCACCHTPLDETVHLLLSDHSLCMHCYTITSGIDALTPAQQRHVLAHALVRSTKDRARMLGCTAGQHHSQMGNACAKLGIKVDPLMKIVAWGLDKGVFAKPAGFEGCIPNAHAGRAAAREGIDVDTIPTSIHDATRIRDVQPKGEKMTELLDPEVATELETAVDQQFTEGPPVIGHVTEVTEDSEGLAFKAEIEPEWVPTVQSITETPTLEKPAEAADEDACEEEAVEAVATGATPEAAEAPTKASDDPAAEPATDCDDDDAFPRLWQRITDWLAQPGHEHLSVTVRNDLAPILPTVSELVSEYVEAARDNAIEKRADAKRRLVKMAGAITVCVLDEQPIELADFIDVLQAAREYGTWQGMYDCLDDLSDLIIEHERKQQQWEWTSNDSGHKSERSSEWPTAWAL